MISPTSGSLIGQPIAVTAEKLSTGENVPETAESEPGERQPAGVDPQRLAAKDMLPLQYLGALLEEKLVSIQVDSMEGVILAQQLETELRHHNNTAWTRCHELVTCLHLARSVPDARLGGY